MTVPLAFENIPLSAREREPFTLSVAPHQTVAVLGDEDSGVDRLGGYAMGLERPRAGIVRTFDTDVEALPERERLAFRRRVGYLPAGDGLLQNLSLRDNVALPLRFGSAATPFDIDGRVKVILVAVRLGPPCGRDVLRREEVLRTPGHAVQQSAVVARSDLAVSALRLCQRKILG